MRIGKEWKNTYCGLEGRREVPPPPPPDAESVAVLRMSLAELVFVGDVGGLVGVVPVVVVVDVSFAAIVVVVVLLLVVVVLDCACVTVDVDPLGLVVLFIYSPASNWRGDGSERPEP